MNRTLASIFLSGLVTAAFSTVAMGDEYLGRANAGYKDIKPALRSDLILLPAIAKLDPVPPAARDPESAALLPVGAASWADLAVWAQKPAQQEALEALKKVTKKTDEKDKEQFAFGLPYGTDDVPLGLIKSKAYAEVGDPPTLSASQLMYMPMLDRLGILVNVEATRLLSEGKAADAVDLLISWVVFGRQMAERQFYRESEWGFRQMVSGLERMRDVLYTDFRGKQTVSTDNLRAYIERLSDNIALNISRIKFPKADLIGAEQIVARVFVPRKGPDERLFATTLASIGAASKPLRLFSEAARWRSSAASHKDQIDTAKMVDIVYGDFAARWAVGFYDRRMLQPYEYGRVSQNDYAVILATIPNMEELINLRQQLRVEAVGTRLAMAHLGRFYTTKEFSPTVAGIQPNWQKSLEKDPFIFEEISKNPMEYFVPIRDEKRGAKEDPKPHIMNVVAGGGMNFQAPLSDDTFVIYSVGSDNKKNWAERVQNTVQKVEGADYLIWPPMISLKRKYLQDTGALK